jgi:stress-induced morphogen
MAMDTAEIERLIKEAIPDAQVQIADLAGDGDHYAAYVLSNAFVGINRIKQHQMVYAALQGKMGSDLHALALQTGVPEDN